MIDSNRITSVGRGAWKCDRAVGLIGLHTVIQVYESIVQDGGAGAYNRFAMHRISKGVFKIQVIEWRWKRLKKSVP